MGTKRLSKTLSLGRPIHVSIQLVSPASGDPRFGSDFVEYDSVSIQLVSPASGDGVILSLTYYK